MSILNCKMCGGELETYGTVVAVGATATGNITYTAGSFSIQQNIRTFYDNF